MKIHEYQAKELFARHGIPVPRGEMAETAEKALAIAEMLGYPCVVKAQVHAGGRGKAGGVKLARNRVEAEQHIAAILGMNLVSQQTGPEGRRVRKLLIEQGLDIARELYLAILLDRERELPVIIASRQGGMEIEAVAREHPDAVFKMHVHPTTGLFPSHIRNLAFPLGLSRIQQQNFARLLTRLYDFFLQSDASLVEINPLIVTRGDDVLALDAKVNFDDNALCRQPAIAALRDIHEEEPLEVEASKYDLNYIRLDGTIGCMVNGAGLAMATMDIIKLAGAQPANFLDVGGGANAEMVENGFRIILSDPNVKGILINIFGGILRCDVLAEGVVKAAQKTGIKVPVVVRMEGTNVDAGRKILADSGLNLTPAVDLSDAAAKVAKMVGA